MPDLTAGSASILEVPIPDGVGVEDPGYPLPPQMVGTRAQLAEMRARLDRVIGSVPVVGDELLDRLLAGFREHAETVAGSIDRLVARLGPLDAGGEIADGDAGPSGRRSSPAEAGVGQCTHPGCTVSGSHVHRPWDRAREDGSLTGRHTCMWAPQVWKSYLEVHDVRVPEALRHLRATAERAGQEPPSGLHSIKDRPDLAQVLIDLVERRRADLLAEREPF